MNKTLQLIGVIAITLLSLFSMTSIAHAQGPEEYCALEQGTLPYQFIPPINNEPVESLTGWTGDFDGNGDACIGGITWSSGEFTKTIQPPDLPYYHGAALVSVTAWSQRANNSGWGRVTVTVGDAQQTPRWRWDGETLQTFSAVIAQGVTHNPTIHLAVDGVLCVDSISITPVDSVERSSDTLIDPDFEGIDWPAWSKVISSTSVENYGPRITDGWLTVNDPAHPLCTPISLGTYSDTIELQLTARKTDDDGAGLKAAIVADPADALTAIYGPRLEPPDQITRPLTMTARIATDDIADNYGEGYLCILEDGWVGAYSDGVYVYSIGATVCQNDECDTLVDSSFREDYSNPNPENGDWFTPLWENGVTEFSSPPTANGAANLGINEMVAQQLTKLDNYQNYTVTVLARKPSETPTIWRLRVGITDNIDDLARFHSDVTPGDGDDYDFWDVADVEINSTTLTVYTTTLSGDIGDPKYLFLASNLNDDYSGNIEVDYVCITGGGEIQCTEPHPIEFDFNSGTSMSHAPFAIVTQGWRAAMSTDIVGNVGADFPPMVGEIKLPPLFPEVRGIFANKEKFFGLEVFPEHTYTAIAYEDRVLPVAITATVVHPVLGTHTSDVFLTVWLQGADGQWKRDTSAQLQAGMGTPIAGRAENEITTVTITPSVKFPVVPQSLALVLSLPNGSWKDGILDGFNSHYIGFDSVELEGCFSGDPMGGECVFSDPDLDEGSGGQPDSFYWLGNYGPFPGRAYLNAGDNIYQNITPPRAGAYVLNMRASSYTNGGPACDFEIDVKDFASVHTIGTYDVQCKIGLVQSYTLAIDLPDYPVEIMFRQRTGSLDIDYLCLSTPESPRCLNANPIFLNGSQGYNGDFTISGGQAVIPPGASIQAASVGYSFNGAETYQLEIQAAPVSSTVDLRIVDDISPPIPTTPYHLISNTTIITQVIDPDFSATRLGPGVWNWNNPYADDLIISEYCITAITGTTWYGGKNCSTLINPDFDQGLLGWDSSGVTAVGGWVVFDSGGSVGQTVVAENLNSDPSFETGIDGWMSGYYNEIYSNNDQARTGDKSLVLEITSGTYGYGYAYKYFDIEPGTEGAEYTAQAWVNGEDIAEPDATSKIIIYEYIDSAFTGKTGYTNNVDWATGWQVVDLQYAIQNANTNRLAFLIRLFDDIDGILYVDDVLLVKGDSIPVEYSTPQDATVHWIGRAPGSAVPNVQATVIVSSTAGVFTTTHTLEGALGGTEYFDPFEIGGDVAVTIIGDVGMELDYICLIPGHYDGPGDGPGGETPPIGEISANCAPPPMMVLSATIQSWMPSIWIWQDTPSNYETVSVYSAAWLRYIGCFLTGLGQMLETKLDEIILWLKALTALQAIDTLASLLNLIVELTALIEEGIDDIVDAIVGPVATVLYLIGVLGLVIAALAGLILLIIAVVSLIWLVPMDFWTGMQDALTSDALVTLPWPDSETHPLYFMIYGFQIFNETIGDTIIYPITIIVIIMGSIYVFLWTIKRFRIKI